MIILTRIINKIICLNIMQSLKTWAKKLIAKKYYL